MSRPERNLPPSGVGRNVTRPANFTSGAVRAYEDLPNAHSCGARWAGSSTCHCGAAGCHQTFVGIGSFDRHRRGGTCTSPAELGMVLAEGRAYQAWTTGESVTSEAA